MVTIRMNGRSEGVPRGRENIPQEVGPVKAHYVDLVFIPEGSYHGHLDITKGAGMG
jgi:hypothetical protein